jgi:hypothetical protein
MDHESSIEVGPYVLGIGGEGGTAVRQSDGAAEADAESLRQALEKPPPKTEEREPAVAVEIDEAAEGTAKVERAVALCKGVVEGQALSPDQVALEVGSLLDCLERLDRKKNHKKSLRMARALATLLMLLKRWADLLQTLRIALRAGEELGDREAIGWARHELGSLRLAAGNVEGADRELHRAREIREQIGDRRGLATTNRNLQVLCDRLRTMLRNEQLVRRGARARRMSLRRRLAGATLAAFLFAGGVAAGMIAGNDNRETAAKRGSADKTGDGNGATSYLLTVALAGEGGGGVEAAGSECPEICEVPAPAGETLTLVAHADRGSEFVGFSDACSGTTCSLTMTAPMTVTATFEPIADEGNDPSADGTGPSAEELEEQEQTEKEQAASEIVE